ncbi:hypothetical protein CHCC14820_1300 [Bacillus paralicheniformis]|uniref:Uncharacterized protein n=1 Tax=Bacillus paralicheniformis TaxID=1648923 RepID=A0ABY3G1G6_9BACI|nr:hypothetical protein CHCC5027_2539 [Bacillus paralicheniformis]TWJ56006.1 hypothetical protein CHCC5022_1134 [Bacillus paralicheniformis]TWK28320.1 hypothetical protein CHCC20372_0955 [Bacillus paralicheniformis]TWK89709.1 hypothetical protein CHCC20333_4551 [Bacillus paralicheniformis]TWL42190.1 hypothetical protein CHCC15381_4798 [Bacillus paralicheniformis]
MIPSLYFNMRGAFHDGFSLEVPYISYKIMRPNHMKILIIAFDFV